MADVLAVEKVLAALMRRCATLPEQETPAGELVAAGARPGNPQPSEDIIGEMPLPPFAVKASPWPNGCHLHYAFRLQLCP